MLDRDDEFHSSARELWSRLVSDGDPLLTSNYVALESFALIQARLGMDAVRVFHDDMLPVLQLQWIAAEDHRAAVQAVLAAGRRSLSLVDCTSFQIMRRFGVKTVFALDRHFGEQGFTVLPEA